MKLSIVIPVYNVEQYIAKCLQSCIDQDLLEDEYEIIVVNDGTQDKSISIVEDLCKQKKNIHIINRLNGGLSAARNTGLQESKGEYVWFVDSDDWIEPNVLKKLYNRASRDNLDVLCFNLQLAFPDGHKTQYNISCQENGKVYGGSSFVCCVDMPPAAWLALYRREYLQSRFLSFCEGILHEDQEFTPRAYYLANRIAFFDDVVYNYNQRQGGIMKSKNNKKRCADLLKVADSLYDFAIKNIEQESPAYYAIIKKVNFAVSQSIAFYEKSYFSLNLYKQKPYYPLDIRNTNSFFSKYHLINLSLQFYVIIYKMRSLIR